MSSVTGGFQRPGESSTYRAYAEEARESDPDDVSIVNHAQPNDLLDTDAQGDLGGSLATPYAAELF
jgi:hypothetical protein